MDYVTKYNLEWQNDILKMKVKQLEMIIEEVINESEKAKKLYDVYLSNNKQLKNAYIAHGIKIEV